MIVQPAAYVPTWCVGHMTSSQYRGQAVLLPVHGDAIEFMLATPMPMGSRPVILWRNTAIDLLPIPGFVGTYGLIIGLLGLSVYLSIGPLGVACYSLHAACCVYGCRSHVYRDLDVGSRPCRTAAPRLPVYLVVPPHHAYRAVPGLTAASASSYRYPSYRYSPYRVSRLTDAIVRPEPSMPRPLPRAGPCVCWFRFRCPAPHRCRVAPRVP